MNVEERNRWVLAWIGGRYSFRQGGVVICATYNYCVGTVFDLCYFAKKELAMRSIPTMTRRGVPSLQSLLWRDFGLFVKASQSHYLYI